MDYFLDVLLRVVFCSGVFFVIVGIVEISISYYLKFAFRAGYLRDEIFEDNRVRMLIYKAQKLGLKAVSEEDQQFVIENIGVLRLKRDGLLFVTFGLLLIAIHSEIWWRLF